MKKMTILLVLAILFVSCRVVDSVPDVVIPYGEDGEYTGFSNILDTYTPEDALRDGCYVIVSTLDAGNPEKDLGLIGGGEAWENFCEKSENGYDAFLRVVHYVDDKPYYTDLYYADGEYCMFDLNDELGLVSYAPQKYLLKLTEEINGREAVMYVITNETEITYRDVEMKFVSSSTQPYTDKKFFWLGFTSYYTSK